MDLFIGDSIGAQMNRLPVVELAHHCHACGHPNPRSVLGAQMVGYWSTEVAKRIDTFAAAIYSAMSADQLSDLDLSYTPPFSAPWDPVQVAAQAWTATVRPDRN